MRWAAEAGALLAVALAGLASPAAAKEPPRADGGSESDGTYGRLEGDASAVLGLGAALGPRGPRGLVDARVRYLHTAGLFVTYEDGALFGTAASPARVLAVGVELRPLFLARWLTGRHFGRSFADLLLDSVGLELGAAWLQPPDAPLRELPALQAGLGVELPLLARASGLFLGVHGGARWGARALSQADVAGPMDRAAFLGLSIAWHQSFWAHVVDGGDPAPR